MEDKKPKYLSTKNIAEMFDVSIMFFSSRKDKEFQKGIHYVQPERHGAVRWCVEAVESWWRSENAKAHNDLIDRLLPIAG